MKNIVKDNNVILRVRGIEFRGTARLVTGGQAFDAGKRALYVKYYGEASSGVIDDWFPESTVVEISLLGPMM